MTARSCRSSLSTRATRAASNSPRTPRSSAATRATGTSTSRSAARSCGSCPRCGSPARAAAPSCSASASPARASTSSRACYIDHAQPNCTSDVLYKNALLGESARTVWIGDVRIRPEATGTSTYEMNRNLLLSDGARADSVPNLEIETGEIVGAGHASATGRFDDLQLFYLQSRGIDPEQARRLVVRGFFADVVGPHRLARHAAAHHDRHRSPAGLHTRAGDRVADDRSGDPRPARLGRRQCRRRCRDPQGRRPRRSAPARPTRSWGPTARASRRWPTRSLGTRSTRVTRGEVLLDGADVLAMTVDERARAGLFLAMQYPVEVPGVSVSNFLRTAATAVRGEAPKLRTWVKEVNEAMDEPGHRPGLRRAQRERGLLRRREEAARDPAAGAAEADRSPSSTRPTPAWTSTRCASLRAGSTGSARRVSAHC